MTAFAKQTASKRTRVRVASLGGVPFKTDAFSKADAGEKASVFGPDREICSTAVPAKVEAGALRARASRLKRLVDVLGAAFGIIFLAPVLILVALIIRLESPGPILFRQRRTGRGGVLFHVYKFRTMYGVEDGATIVQARQDDPRVTRFGAFLRRSSIDELPQLINVLKNEMSLVGPRPHALAHDIFYGGLIDDYRLRFLAKPGISGLAQVSGFRGATPDLDAMAGRIALDVDYIADWSVTLDMRILLRTVIGGPFHPAAFEWQFQKKLFREIDVDNLELCQLTGAASRVTVWLGSRIMILKLALAIAGMAMVVGGATGAVTAQVKRVDTTYGISSSVTGHGTDVAISMTGESIGRDAARIIGLETPGNRSEIFDNRFEVSGGPAVNKGGVLLNKSSALNAREKIPHLVSVGYKRVIDNADDNSYSPAAFGKISSIGVSEPATWGMMLLGLGLMAAGLCTMCSKHDGTDTDSTFYTLQ